MAKTVNPTALADGLKILHAVDDDNTTIREFVTAAVDANMSIEAGVTVGAGTWKGQTRYYMNFGRDGLTPYGIAYDPGNLPPAIDQFDVGMTCVVLFHQGTSATGNLCDILRQGVTGINPRIWNGLRFGIARHSTSTRLMENTTDVTGKAFAGIVFQSGGTGEMHYAAEGDNTTTIEDSDALGNWGGNGWQAERLHGIPGNSAGDWSAYYVAAFEGKLSQAKLDAILADPEAYFFSAAGPTPIQWDGPDILDQVWTQDQAIVDIDVSTGFSGTETPFSFADAPTYSLPTGVTISGAGVISGTPTVTQAATGYAARGTDQTPDTADTNVFNITVNAAALLPTLVIPVIKDANEAVQADIAGCSIRARDTTDDTLHKYEGTLTTDASGNLSVSDAALTTGRVYACEIEVPSTPSNLRGLRYVTAVDA